MVHSELDGPTVPGTTIVESEVEVLLPTEEVAAFVGQAFADLLHRQPTPDRLAYWTDRIVHGAPRTELLEGIVNGAEYRGRLVNTTFLDLINRAPTATERNLWTAKLGAGGLSQAELVAFLGGSNAFKTLSGHHRWLRRPAPPGDPGPQPQPRPPGLLGQPDQQRLPAVPAGLLDVPVEGVPRPPGEGALHRPAAPQPGRRAA